MDELKNLPADLGDLLAAAQIGTWVWDPASGEVTWDATTKRIYGIENDEFDGTFEAYAGLIHPDDLEGVTELIEALAVRGGEYTTKHRVVRPSGVVRWIEGQGRIVVENGVAKAGFGIVYDVTDRATLEDERDRLRVAERAAQAARTATEQDLAFLIEVSDALSGSLNVDTVLERLTALLVPSLADRCQIVLMTGKPVDGVVAARSSESGLNITTSADIEELERILHVSGRLPASDLEELLEPGTRGSQSIGLAVALATRGQRIGTLFVERDDGLWTARAESLVNAVGRRASAALDTATLFQEQLTVSKLLAQSVRPTELAESPSFEVAVHYQAATELTRLGGDFYDFFQVTPTRWMAVLGDITGKGIVAAARAGLVRSAVRAAAVRHGEAVELLHIINTMMIRDPDRPMMSLVTVGLEVVDGQVHFEIGNAGHPPPFLISGSGAATDVKAGGVLVGFVDQPLFTPAIGTLNSEDTLIIYSDGVTEARLGGEEYGRDRLIETVVDVAGAGPGPITKAVAASIDAWTNGRVHDDLTLLAITAR